jgi:AsmA family protein
MSRRQKWVLWPIAALAALVAILLVVFDWNWLKGPLESRVSAALSREFRIEGDLDVDLSLHPRITVTDVRLANPDWASDAPMLAVPRASAVVDVIALLQGEVKLPEVAVGEPALRLETRPDGPPNWQFSDEPSEGPPTVPEIGELQISGATVDYLDHGSGRTIAARLDQVTAGIDGATTLTADGTLGGEPLKLAVDGGAVSRLWGGGEPFRSKLDLQLGESDLGGELAVDLSGAVPSIDATLHSDRVQASDVDWLASPRQEEAQAEKQSQAAIPPAPDLGIDFGQLPALDLDLAYTIAKLEGPEVALQGVDLQASLHDRLPEVALSGSGTYQDQPVTLDVRAGPAEDAERDQSPYRIDAGIAAGNSRFTATGGVAEPQQLQGVDVEISATSPDLTELLRALGISAPPLPDLQVAGQLLHDGDAWRLEQASAQIGESDVSGQMSIDLSGPRPLVSAKLDSKRLRLTDFMPEGGAEQQNAPAPDLPLIENGDLNLQALPAIDADLELHAGYVELPEFTFDQLDLVLQMRDRVPVINASGEGRFRQQPLSIEAHAGSVDYLDDPAARYPLELHLATQETNLRVGGSADRPLGLAGLDVDVALDGPDLARLGDVLQLPLPATPPYDLAGKVTHQADQQRWNLIALKGTVGDSDLSGDVSFELSGERPTMVANLHSDKVDFDDLGVLVGAPAGTAPGETASPEQKQQAAAAQASEYVLPDTPFDVPELRAIDARVKFEGDSVQAKKLPLESIMMDLTLEDGTLRFEPLRFNLGAGQLEAVMNLDSASDVLDGDFDLTLRQINLNELLRNFDIEVADIDVQKEGTGTFGGRAKLHARGRSIHELAASANGQLAAIMDGGQINALIVEAIGLDVGEALGLLIADEGDTKTMVPLECFVGQFAVEDGLIETEALVLKTSDSTITGSGQVDLGKERLDLRLLAHPQDASVLTASTPVRIEGSFKQPEIGLASEELAEKSLAALALGVVLPVVGAVLPFIETGEEDKGLSCAALMRNAEQSADVPDNVSSEDAAQ